MPPVDELGGQGSRSGRQRQGVRWALVAALPLSMITLLWWPVVGLLTENFGGDCTYYFAESAQGGHCYQVNQAAKAALPWLVLGTLAGTTLSLAIPRRFPAARQMAVALAILCALAAFGVGGWAMWVGQP